MLCRARASNPASITLERSKNHALWADWLMTTRSSLKKPTSVSQYPAGMQNELTSGQAKVADFALSAIAAGAKLLRAKSICEPRIRA
jgi:hypothetical protein